MAVPTPTTPFVLNPVQFSETPTFASDYKSVTYPNANADGNNGNVVVTYQTLTKKFTGAQLKAYDTAKSESNYSSKVDDTEYLFDFLKVRATSYYKVSNDQVQTYIGYDNLDLLDASGSLYNLYVCNDAAGTKTTGTEGSAEQLPANNSEAFDISGALIDYDSLTESQ